MTDKKTDDEREIDVLWARSGFDTRHYRVFTDKGLSDIISPNVNHARRVLADAISHGGEGWIFETVEHWQDKGATFEKIELEDWL
jgi:hypothetical protein